MENITRLLIQLVIAIACASLANLLLPRRIPGGVLGLMVIGLAGVFVGEWASKIASSQYNLNWVWLKWQVEGVPIIPSLVGSLIVLYVVTAFLSWGRYGNR